MIMKFQHFCSEIFVDMRYKSIKKQEVAMEARSLQFDSLQNIADLQMHYEIGHCCIGRIIEEWADDSLFTIAQSI